MQKTYELKKKSKRILLKLFLKTSELIINIFIKTTLMIGGKFTGLSKKVHLNFYQKRAIPWLAAKGDTTLRLNYPLNENSVVFDIGGYQGNWARDIFCLYGCSIYIFEPVTNFIDRIKERFKNNKKIQIYPFGLSNENKKVKFSMESNSSSEFIKKENTIEVEMRDIYKFIKDKNIQKINLMKINIEGGEYPLLERIIKKDLVKKIENIQIQFHDFVPEAEKRMEKIQNKLKKTHKLTYQEKFIWENWEKNI